MNDRKTGHYVVGIHTSKGRYKTMHDAINGSYVRAPSSATQIFTHGPQTLSMNKINIEELNKLSSYIKIYVHEPYPCFIWKGTDEGFKNMLNVFSTANDIGASGVVVHLPRATVETVVKHLTTFLGMLEEEKIDIPIVLETPSNKPHPTMSWETPEKLEALTLALAHNGINNNRVGLCIDTAHVYIAGAQIQSRKDATKWLKKLPIGWVHLFHLNGNVYKQGVRFGDKHAIPFAGDDQIWGQKNMTYNDSGCKEFIEYAKGYNIPVIFEGKASHKNSDVLSFIQTCGRV
jgi:endonuclease IV